MSERPRPQGRHGTITCRLRSPRTPSHIPSRRSGPSDPPADPSARKADQAGARLASVRRRLIDELGHELAAFLREQIAAGRSQAEVVNSLRRVAPAALLLGSLADVSAMCEAAITVAALEVADEADPPPTPRRRRPAKP